MADEYIKDKKITQEEADRLQAPMELDLMALFRVMQLDMLESADGYEGTPESLIDELVKKLTGPTGGEIAR